MEDHGREPRRAASTKTIIEGTPGPVLELEIEEDSVLPNTPAPIDKPAPAHLMQGRSPMDQLQDLLARGITLDQVRDYLELQRQWEAEEARKAYHAAMAAFKREELPEILKKHHVNYPSSQGGNVEYFHEELFDVTDSVVPAMAKHGLTHKWVPGQAGKDIAGMVITVRCVVTHEAGHSEYVELFASPDTSGKKNNIQSLKSTISYLERITLLAITGTAAKGMDDDGRGSGPPVGDAPPARGKPASEAPRARAPTSSDDRGFINGLASEKQIAMLDRICRDRDIPIIDLCAQMQVPGLSDVPRNKVDTALQWLEKQGKR